MDEEIADIAEIPVIIPEDGYLRRCSTGRLIYSDGGIQVMSRYLSRSIGSCHDACKFGTKHIPETKPWKPILSKTHEMQTQGKHLGRNQLLAEQNEKMQVSLTLKVRHASVSSSNTQISGNKETNNLTPMKVNRSATSKLVGSGDKLSGDVKKWKQLGSTPYYSPDVLSSKQRTESERRKSLGSFEMVEEKGMVKTSSLRHFVRDVSTISARNSKNTKEVSLPKNHKSKFDRVSSDDHAECLKSTPVSRVPPSPGRKIVTRVENGIDDDAHRASKPVSGSAEPNKYGGVRVSKKSQSSLSSKSTPSVASSERDENECENRKAVSKFESKSGAKKGVLIISKYKQAIAQKLNFRRGKVVAVEPEATSPKRLKFNRKAHREEQTDNHVPGSKLLKKVELEEADDDDIHTADHATTTGLEKVVLIHQNIETKTETHDLLNNVIEETANKNVEEKMSKVRALVGAFETVISLQDSKSWGKSQRR